MVMFATLGSSHFVPALRHHSAPSVLVPSKTFWSRISDETLEWVMLYDLDLTSSQKQQQTSYMVNFDKLWLIIIIIVFFYNHIASMTYLMI